MKDKDFLEQAMKELDEAAFLMKAASRVVKDLQAKLDVATKDCAILQKQLDEYALLLFQPQGESHHNAMECPYCKEWLNKNQPKQWQSPYVDKMYEGE